MAQPGQVAAADAPASGVSAWDQESPPVTFFAQPQTGFQQSVGNFYELDSEVAISAQFTLPGTVTPADPASVVLLVMTPTGSEQSFAYPGGGVTRAGIGLYSFDLALTQPGQWLYKWQGIGAGVIATSPDVPINAKPSAFPLMQILVPPAGAVYFTGVAPSVTGAS